MFLMLKFRTGAQRAEMEDAGLSVGLMYGNGGGQAASTAGGNATQPNAPKTNPVEVALRCEVVDVSGRGVWQQAIAFLPDNLLCG